jgi:hypothetical protein
MPKNIIQNSFSVIFFTLIYGIVWNISIPSISWAESRDAQGEVRVDASNYGKRYKMVLISNKLVPQLLDRKYQLALGAMGFPPTTVDLADLGRLDLSSVRTLIVPLDISKNISPLFVEAVVREVRKGLQVYTEEDSELSRALGVQFVGTTSEVDAILDKHHPEIEIRWREKVVVKEIGASDLKIYSEAKSNQSPLIVGGTLGQGRWLYAAVPLDEPEGWGYGRFPYVHEAFLDWFNLQPPFSRSNLIVYLDWAYVSKENPKELAARISAKGISEVHLSSFYSLSKSKEFFLEFIENCHNLGILVYSWLELPTVNSEFWIAHPECREKTATGRDAKVDWRQLIALEIPHCMAAVKSEIKTLLEAFPWDGVDVAELYFDSPTGFDARDNFTPMSDKFRDDFISHSVAAGEAGVDPIEFLDPASIHFYKRDAAGFARLLRYRSQLCLNLNREIIQFVQGLRVAEFRDPLSVTLTLIDAVIDREMGGRIGIDTVDFMKLQKELGFDLQVEDPYSLWSSGPSRYQIIGESYRNAIKSGSRLTVDINIVDRPQHPYPTSRQTGMEFLELLYHASNSLDQVCIYSETTPYVFDFKFAGAALAGLATLEPTDSGTLKITSPYSVLYRTDTRGKSFSINGVSWGCVNNKGVLMPPGSSILSTLPATPSLTLTQEVSPRITSMGGASVRECTLNSNGIRFRYDERRAFYVTLDRPATSIRVDEKLAFPPSHREGDLEVVYLSAGSHTVDFYF